MSYSKDLARDVALLSSAIIEKALEEALQGGKYGVKVTWHKNEWLPTAEPDPSVPYGEIHEFHPER